MSTTRINPEDLNKGKNTVLRSDKKQSTNDVNPIAVGGAAVVGAGAAVGVTAMAMDRDDDLIEVEATEETGVFEQAAATVNKAKETEKPAEKVEEEEKPEREKPEEEKPEDENPGEKKSGEEKPEEEKPEDKKPEDEKPIDDKTDPERDDILDDVDPEVAAREITGEVEHIDANDIQGGAAFEFGEVEKMFTESGEEVAITTMMTRDEDGEIDSAFAIVDVNNDGEFDAVYNPAAGEFEQIPISVSMADVEMQNQNYDEYVAYNPESDINPEQDSAIDQDINFG